MNSMKESPSTTKLTSGSILLWISNTVTSGLKIIRMCVFLTGGLQFFSTMLIIPLLWMKLATAQCCLYLFGSNCMPSTRTICCFNRMVPLATLQTKQFTYWKVWWIDYFQKWTSQLSPSLVQFKTLKLLFVGICVPQQTSNITQLADQCVLAKIRRNEFNWFNPVGTFELSWVPSIIV